ncbi:SIR2 family protein [Methyloligella sp. 2.7D]|uniref:SIR2 family protein n=1 Tax=unclassified Methyloligella TaxID=2625955 RepID=UPI00157C464E|nr:SIR2 family protein [Methyloligella sp. GL2]QKP77715.1 SIR2 family protein [Methyloligella sp. GL2]
MSSTTIEEPAFSDSPHELNPNGSILFLGSGFSKEAKNIRKTHLPAGSALKRELENILSVPADRYDLKVLADELNSSNHNLYQILYELFTVTEVAKYQSDLVSLPWMRLYTTNYDDSVEFSYSSKRINAVSYSYNDVKPRRLKNRSVIHLHGTIRNATEDNVLDQIVLNETSYIRQHFEQSIWYDDFVRDIRFADACFFVGYSLNDYHISALLMQNPNTREKIFFVTNGQPDRIFANRIKPFGKVLPIGAENFTRLCYSLPEPAPSIDPYNLKCFKFIDPHKDKHTLAPPTALEIRNLVTFGTFNYKRCLSTLPKSDYVVARQEIVSESVEALSKSKCLLIHSRIGNGKTIFLYILSNTLSEHGYRCFMCRPNAVTLQQDIELLKKFKKIIIIFDSYNAAVETIPQLTDLPDDTKYIVTVRTGVQEVRLHEIQEKLPMPLERVNLNGFRAQDVGDFLSLLDRSGVRASNLEDVISQCKDVREVVVQLYDNSEIRQAIHRELVPLLGDREFGKVFVAIHLLKWIGQEADPAFLRSVTRMDPYSAVARFREVVGDLLR